MSAHPETEDFQASRALFLQAVALSLRNAHVPRVNMDFLREVEFRGQLIETHFQSFGLSPTGVQDFWNLVSGLRHYLTHPRLAIGDPGEGAGPH